MYLSEEMREIVELVRPWQMATVPKVRVGNANDGGYVMAAVALEADALLSIGIGWDVSFDLELAERGARVLQFDHTLDPGYLPGGVEHPNFDLQRLGWGPRSEGDLLSLADMIERMDDPAPSRPCLSFDVEGAEYEAITTVTVDQLARFETIACELHDWHRLGEPEFNRSVRALLAKLAAGHAPVHVHANNNRGAVTVAGVTLPEVLEVTYLRRDLDEFPAVSTDPMPGPLDNPNNPYLPDLEIRLG